MPRGTAFSALKLKPDFPQGGLKMECPHCKKTSLFQRHQLIYADFHDRSSSRGKSSLLTRFGVARGTNSFGSLAACVGLSAAVPIRDRTRLPFAVLAHQGPHRRLSLCSPASPETSQREHPELALLRPVGLTARPGRLRVEKFSMCSTASYAAAQWLASVI